MAAVTFIVGGAYVYVLGRLRSRGFVIANNVLLPKSYPWKMLLLVLLECVYSRTSAGGCKPSYTYTLSTTNEPAFGSMDDRSYSIRSCEGTYRSAEVTIRR